MADRRNNNVLEALSTPAHCLYLADPSRLSVLDIEIIAQATVQEVPQQRGTVYHDQSKSISANAPNTSSFQYMADSKGLTSSSSNHAPPSSYKSPPNLPSPSSTSTSPKFQQAQIRSRPRSLELGARAKDAILDIGRGFSYGLRNSSKSDLVESSESLLPPGKTTDDRQRRRGSRSSASSQAIAWPLLHDTRLKADTRERHARQICSVQPQSLHYGPRSSALSNSTSVTLRHSSVLEISAQRHEFGTVETQWEHLGRTETEFAKTAERQVHGISGEAKRAGIFSAVQKEDLGSEASDDGSDDEGEEGLVAYDPVENAAPDFSTEQMLLKVTPPLRLLRQRIGASLSTNTSSETTQIFVKVRLEVPATEESLPLDTKSAVYSGVRFFKARGNEGRSRIVFVSASSSGKLFEAVGNSKINSDGSMFTGPLSGRDAARLEGIHWVVLDDERMKAKPVQFEWKWEELARGSIMQADLLGERTVKCACAFIELNEDLKLVRILASFAFLISTPTLRSKERHTPAIVGTSTDCHPYVESTQSYEGGQPVSRPESSHKMQKSSKGHPEARGLGLGGMSDFASSRSLMDSPKIMMTSPPPRAREEFAVDHHPSTMQVDHTEMQLKDVEEDGPVMRAALQNLDKRTASLKRAAKAILKAAADVRDSLKQLQESEALLDQSMESASLLAPSTWGFVTCEVLQTGRREMHKFRHEEERMLELHVEAPLRAVLQMCRDAQDQSKRFESESKLYYAATQKWLSGRMHTQQSGNGASSYRDEVMESITVGFDKASLKQERVDDKQRLRQARFYLARLETFRAGNEVQGGEAELQLATHALALYRWHCAGETGKDRWTHFEQSLQEQLIQSQRRSESIRSKCVEVEGHMRELTEMLGVSGGMEVEVEEPLDQVPSMAVENTFGGATRQAGMKIKTILSSIGTNKLVQSPATSSSPNVVLGSDGFPLKTSSNVANKMKSRFQQKSSAVLLPPPSRPASTGIPSFAKLQQRLRPTSFAALESQQGDAVERNRSRSISDSRRAPLSSPPATSPHPVVDAVSPLSAADVKVRLPGRGLPLPRRSLSLSIGAAETSLVDGALQSNPSSPSLNRHVSDGKTRASSFNQRPAVLLSSSSPPPTGDAPPIGIQNQSNRVSLLQPRRAAQQSRKKEGVLWAMSKPINGVGGADAPKVVLRSQNWRECWVVLSGSGHLGEYADWKDIKVLELSQPLIDLRFATVREARGVERRFTFEIVTRDRRRFFQASNEVEMKEWTSAIGMAIESLLNGTSSIRQIDKVARVADAQSSYSFASGGSNDEFGRGLQSAMPATALGQYREFSQSLTDLSNLTSGGPSRLFQRSSGGGKEDFHGKKDSKNHGSGGGVNLYGHLSTLSEGGAQSNRGDQVDFPPCIIPRKTPWSSQHERGISNKTPVSGYIQQQDVLYEARADAYSSASELDQPDYDRKIEEMILSSYGGSSLQHSPSQLSSTSLATATRRSSFVSKKREERASASLSSKYSRSREILDLAAKPENNYCADCRTKETKWASWMLNGEPRCVFICITCSGIHRGLGVSVSRVKSVELDDWTEEQVESARQWGNDRANQLYEARKPKELTTVTFGDARSRSFWTEKYVRKAWYDEGGISMTRPDHRRFATEEENALESLLAAVEDEDSDLSVVDETWDGGSARPRGMATERGGGNNNNNNNNNHLQTHRASPPPAVFVSMLEGQGEEEGDETAWKSKSNSSLEDSHQNISGASRSSTEDHGPFSTSASSPQASTSFEGPHRRSRRRSPAHLDRPAFSPSLAA
ncbi:hypothetical protein CBS101457_004293 [Exobasidium rhododendri]|nr:hypothetical protein CBS101457_004293 [Exobasidium rhododendri]